MLAILGWIVFGLIVGVLAKLVMPGKDPGGFVMTRLRSRVVHSRTIAHHRLSVAKRAGARRDAPHLVAQTGEFFSCRLRNELLHRNVAAGERSLREAADLERLLHVETEVGDVGDELRVRLRLVEPAHDAEPDLHVAFRHEGRNDRVERPLSRRHLIGMPVFEREQRAAVVEHVAELHEAADRIAIRPSGLRERLADHRDVRRLESVTRLEQPATEERDPHRLEISRAREPETREAGAILRDLPAQLHVLFARTDLVGRRELEELTVRIVAAAQRKPGDQACGGHAGKLAHPLEDRIELLDASGTEIRTSVGDRQIEQQRIVEFEPGIDRHDQRHPDVADDELLERNDGGAPAGVRLRVLALQPAGDRNQFGTRLIDRHAGLQTRNDLRIVVLANGALFGRVRQRHP